MAQQQYDIGMVGLGVMGRNLSLNMADHGFSVAGFDLDAQKVQVFQAENESQRIQGFTSLVELAAALKPPRALIMLVPAGPAVDAVIRDVLPVFTTGDILIDGGNSYYKDTALRQKMLAEKGLILLGMGVSGGESGARHGPSLMPGGPREGYERVCQILDAIAAKVDGEPCEAYCGPGAAGHYVKMVHNGLEYGLMELIAESYDLFRRGLHLEEKEIQEVFARWNRTEVNSFLVEITAEILNKLDDRTGKRLVDLILDEARQKGTGKWTSQDAMDLQVPLPTVDAAVSTRDLSGLKAEREEACRKLVGPEQLIEKDREYFVELVRQSLYTGMILTFTQGMSLLHTASREYHFDVDLQTIARIWRGGCIIRSTLLEPIRQAYQANQDLPNLLLDPVLGGEVMKYQAALRAVVVAAAESGIPAAGFMASLSYYDSYRSDWLPANLIQAQRDFFGAHNYERVDEKGLFHTVWEA
jgi:6-phosphogluconate dehydrogenase